MSEAPETLDLLWGAREIARFLGRTERAVFHMLEAGDIPCARQVGRRWVASREALRRHFEGEPV